MSRGPDADYKCSLSPKALKRAIEELNEVPENRLIEVKTLRQRLEKVPGLRPRTDTKFLLAFLRGCCFDQERTFLQIKNFYQILKDNPEIFGDLKPSRIRHVTEESFFDVLKERSKEGCVIVVFRIRMWDPDRASMADLIRLYTICMLKLIEDEDNQVFGVHFLNDSGGMTMKQITSINPSESKFVLNLAFYAFPLHIRWCDYVHENKLFDIFFALFSQFMDETVTKKIHFYGTKVEALHEAIAPEHLPNDLGGTDEMFSNKKWMKEIQELDKWHEENNKFGFLDMDLENKKKEKSQENAGMQGLGGSFKKLEI